MRSYRAGKLISTHVQHQLGKLLVAMVRQEINRDWALESGTQTTGRLPQSPKFLASFGYELEDGDILVVSSWPNVDALIEGRKPYRMEWLTQQAGVELVPMEGPPPKRELLFRVTPKFKFQAWKHPGVKPHGFLDRAFKRFLPKAERMVGEALMRELQKLPVV